MNKHTNRFFNISNTGTTLTLSIYDMVGADMFGQGITAGMVQDAINQSDSKSITVRLNSPGGDAHEGVSIYNVLRSSGKPINTIVDGLAASAASIILMAGDTRTVNTGASVMIHEAMAMAFGNAADMVKMSETLTSVTGSIADIYVARTGIDKDKVLQMQAVETWMNADEAVELGFATSVSKEHAAIKNTYDLKMFKNAPAALRNEAEETDAVEPVVDEVVTEPVVHDGEVAAVIEQLEQTFDPTNLYRLQLEINKRR